MAEIVPAHFDGLFMANHPRKDLEMEKSWTP